MKAQNLQATQEKMNKHIYIKMKNFCMENKLYAKTKGKQKTGKNIFTLVHRQKTNLLSTRGPTVKKSRRMWTKTGNEYKWPIKE